MGELVHSKTFVLSVPYRLRYPASLAKIHTVGAIHDTKRRMSSCKYPWASEEHTRGLFTTEEDQALGSLPSIAMGPLGLVKVCQTPVNGAH